MNMVEATDRVRSILVEQESECTLNEVLRLCPELSWYQVILAVDYLNRSGEILVLVDEARGCKVLVPRQIPPSAIQHGLF